MDPYLEARWSDVHLTLTVGIGEALQPHLPAPLRARCEEFILPEDEPIEYSGGPVIDRFVRIIDVTDRNRLVTSIEVLSPLTKSAGPGNDQYRRRLDDYARDGVSVVEIDLLRSPRDRLLVKAEALPLEHRSPYLIAVRRGSRGDRWEVYPVPLRNPIPNVRIPLRPMDQDVRMELRPLIRRAYLAGAHDDIDYARPPDPPLGKDDEAWSDELLRKAGRR
jgi:Protein of unknown function (DUF4058)